MALRSKIMFLARDRSRFSREIQALGGTVRAPKPAPAVADDKFARIEAVNETLDKAIRPLFEAYAEIVRKANRSCDFKVLAGSADSYPLRAAMADFWLDLTEVPGVAHYFISAQSDGGDWHISSRPGFDGRRSRHEPGRLVIPNSKRFGANFEGILQQFIRLTF
jgi:hypothetical protein